MRVSSRSSFSFTAKQVIFSCYNGIKLRKVRGVLTAFHKVPIIQIESIATGGYDFIVSTSTLQVLSRVCFLMYLELPKTLLFI